jgi:hypothetical protein
MGRVAGLAEREIELVDWAQFTELDGPGGDIGNRLRALLDAGSSDAAGDAYWRLENHVVAQNELFDSAEPTVSVIVAALADERPRYVRIALLDLLYLILTASPSAAIKARCPDLVERCHARAREGLWLLVREAAVGAQGSARDVLELLGELDRIPPDEEPPTNP